MESSLGESAADSRKKAEQILQEFFAKVTHSVLLSRVPFPESALTKSKQNKWVQEINFLNCSSI